MLGVAHSADASESGEVGVQAHMRMIFLKNSKKHLHIGFNLAYSKTYPVIFCFFWLKYETMPNTS